jgi:hypothetical protein
MLEDDVEMIHQIAGRFESRASKIKGREKQALSHAKMEAIMYSKDVQKNIKDSQKTAKHTLTVNKEEERRKRLKSERDEVRLKANEEIKTKTYFKVTSVYDELKHKKSNDSNS